MLATYELEYYSIKPYLTSSKNCGSLHGLKPMRKWKTVSVFPCFISCSKLLNSWS